MYGQVPVGGMPPLASWGRRVAAALIDGIIMYVPERIVWYALGSTPAAAQWGALLVLLIAIGLSYVAGTTGQTPGKKVVGIHLLREADGQVLGVGRAFGRWLLHILDAVCCGLGYLWPLWDEKRQTFADKIVRSVVIKP
ncbi:RDD family protein [Streptomyces sp. NPDC088910]|uniref:RDD family protein n=1 Tax=Streptomyces sp. NPDC088910 TaxID=3365911 RepID=UPI0037FB6F88